MKHARIGLGRAGAAVIGGILLAAAPLRAEPVPVSPSPKTGDLRLHAAATAYRHGAEKAFVEVTIRIPYQEIRFVQEGERYAARLRPVDTFCRTN